MEIQRLPVVVVANEYGGVISCIEEEGIVSGEVIVMQRIYRTLNNYLVEETRFARLCDDLCRMSQLKLTAGQVLSGSIIMKQRSSFAPGYVKLKGITGDILKEETDIPVWGLTYYTEDQEDKDELIESLNSE